MSFQVGDQVVHNVYGLGIISQIDEKIVQDALIKYYVVTLNNLTLYVPISSEGENHLRLPTPAGKFEELFTILRSPAEPLSNDKLIRKSQLSNIIKDGKLESLCKAIRDLSFHRRTAKLNENDLAFLNRVQNHLLNEWSLALSISVAQAKHELSKILGDQHVDTLS